MFAGEVHPNAAAGEQERPVGHCGQGSSCGARCWGLGWSRLWGTGKGNGLPLSSRRAVGESCWEVKWEVSSKISEGALRACQAIT